VRIDLSTLVNDLIDNHNGYYLNTGELLAAAQSSRQGDPAPLLRLAAENHFLIVGDGGDPTIFSGGAGMATACGDAVEHWDWSVGESERAAQYAKAIANLPVNYFAPFSQRRCQ
jgi:hypothetical protein